MSGSNELQWDYSIIPMDESNMDQTRISRVAQSPVTAVTLTSSNCPNEVFVCDVTPNKPKYLLKSLRVENFKSYSGIFEISPFPVDENGNPLVCVVGPNGSGKSNLMDAVAFCFNCADSTKLRGDGNCSNLISNCSKADEDSIQPTSASVSVTLLPTVVSEDSTELTFTRSVSRRGDSKYSLNGKVMSLEQYREKMRGCGLDIKGSFLVFQGDVESLALADPGELGAVFDRVSGSADLRKEFDAEAKRKQELETEYGKLATRKRQLLAERKKLKNELIEIQKIDDLLAKKSKTTDDFFLSKLWLVDQGGEEDSVAFAENIPPKNLKSPEEIERAIEHNELELERGKGERAKADMKQAKLSRKLITEEVEMRKTESEISDCRLQMDLSERKISKISALVTSRHAKLGSLREKLHQVESQIRALETELSCEEKKMDKLSLGGGKDHVDAERDKNVVFPFLRENGWTGNESDMERKLSFLRNVEIPLKLCNFFDEISRIEKDVNHRKDDRKTLEGRRSELGVQLAKNEMQERQMKEKLETLEQVVSEKTNLLKKLEKDLSSSKTVRLRNKVEKLEQQRKTFLDELSDIKESEAELNRERSMQEIVIELRSKLGPENVFGRLIELIAPADPRLGFAVQTAAGKYIDAILVRDVQTAKAAVNWLKSEKRSVVLSFIPVEDVSVPPRLPQGGEDNSYVLGTDCVQIKSYCGDSEQLIKRGIQFVFGDTLVCETLAEARKAAGQRGFVSVVTINGEKISSNGNITVGGISSSSSGSGSRFRQRNVHEIAAKLDQTEKEMDDVRSDLKREETACEKVAVEIRKTELELSASKSVLETTKSEFVRLNESVGNIAKFLSENRCEIENIDHEILQLSKGREMEVRNLIANVMRASREFLSATTTGSSVVVVPEEVLLAVGGSVNDPTQCVKNQLEEAKKAQKEKIHLIEKSMNSFKAERKCLVIDLEELGDSAQLEIDELEARKSLSQSEKLLKVKEGEFHVKKVSLSTLREEIDGLKKTKTDIESDLRGKIAEIQSLKKDLVEAQIAASKSEKSALRIRNLKVQILKESVMHSAYIPLLLQPEDLAMGSQREVSRSILESLFVSFGETDDSMEPLIAEVIAKIDFDTVPVEVKRKGAFRKGRSALFLSELEREFRETIKDVEMQIEAVGGVQRSGRTEEAGSVLEQIELGLKSLTCEAEKLKANLSACCDKLREIRRTRNDRFIKCFRFVSKKVDDLYKLLTSYSGTSTASASIDLEVPVTITSDLGSVEAFNSGIIFSLMPPYKRYTNIELLSGGEKTVAAVALLFSLLAFSAPPFSMVDEIDAALDAENVAVLAKFMKSAVSQQLIVISLKEKLYVNADCLIGVFKDSHTNGSGLVTLDLRPYPLEAEEVSKHEKNNITGPLMTPAPSSAPVTSRREGRVIAGGA